LTFNATVFNEDGQLFDNFTSLAFSWHSSNQKLVSFITQGKTSRLVYLAAKEGTANIRVSVSGYDEDVLSEAKARKAPLSSSQLTRFVFMSMK